uniref:Uncharacterized protein n=1 Tax=Bionectria ochroleuca TaxID=29856 RepID=A0A8H7KFJ2_BIOOC
MENPVIYHDMHNRYGESLTWRSLSTSSRYSELWEKYMTSQRSLDHLYHKLFVEDFFGAYYPVAFHGHASDAMVPTTIASLLLHIAAYPSSLFPDSDGSAPPVDILPLLDWNSSHRQSPRLAILSRSFGAGYGPLASICPFEESKSVACGSPPLVIDLQQTAEDLDSTLTRFKNDGGIALIVQIIESQWPWTVIESKTLQTLSNICSRLKLPVVVDETITALRCGAPFAHQRPDYLEVINPDFVIFGKGLKANGIGVNFDGETLRALSIYQEGDRYRCAFRWHDKHTRAISVPTLIEALFTLDMARDEDWPLRSIEIGRQIRSAICAQERGKEAVLKIPNRDR